MTNTTEPQGVALSAPHLYQMYGVRLRSAMPLACPKGMAPGLTDVSLDEATPSLFAQTTQQGPQGSDVNDWFHRVCLPDGSEYLRWSGLFEFLVSPDGRHIACHALNGVSQESFQTYLVSQVLSFALLKQGIEPLHATVVVIREQAVAFLGSCGYGKSSLGAAFLRAGHTLLTDDLLVTSHPPHQPVPVMAHPGSPRIKLFPKIAKMLLGKRRVGARMNPDTNKLILPLSRHEYGGTAVPLKAIYVLRPPSQRRPCKQVAIRSLSPRRACLALIASTFNCVITEPARLARQFDWAAELAAAVPVKSLSYPRSLTHIPAVLAAIQKDLGRTDHPRRGKTRG